MTTKSSQRILSLSSVVVVVMGKVMAEVGESVGGGNSGGGGGDDVVATVVPICRGFGAVFNVVAASADLDSHYQITKCVYYILPSRLGIMHCLVLLLLFPLGSQPDCTIFTLRRRREL